MKFIVGSGPLHDRIVTGRHWEVLSMHKNAEQHIVAQTGAVMATRAIPNISWMPVLREFRAAQPEEIPHTKHATG